MSIMNRWFFKRLSNFRGSMSKQIWSINCNGNFDTWIDVECYDDVVVVMMCGAGSNIGEENI